MNVAPLGSFRSKFGELHGEPDNIEAQMMNPICAGSALTLSIG